MLMNCEVLFVVGGVLMSDSVDSTSKQAKKQWTSSASEAFLQFLDLLLMLNTLQHHHDIVIEVVL